MTRNGGSYMHLVALALFQLTHSSTRSGTVQSKLRQLVLRLENVEALKMAHPFIKGFSRVSHCITEDEVNDVVFNRTNEAVANRTQEEMEAAPWQRTVYSTTFYVGLGINPKPGEHDTLLRRPLI